MSRTVKRSGSFNWYLVNQLAAGVDESLSEKDSIPLETPGGRTCSNTEIKIIRQGINLKQFNCP